MNYNSTQLMVTAQKAALSAADIALQGFRSEIAVELKADIHDVVTYYDRATEDRIRGLLLEDYPESAIVGEEGGIQGDGELVWYVDPIDGTSNFARGIAFWCISIAASYKGEIVAGAIFDPVADNMFHADGTGAYLNGEPIHAKGFAGEDQATILAHFPMPADLAADAEFSLREYARIVGAYSSVRNVGSGALCLAHVAAGWADGTFNFGTNAWDVAAGSFILKQAGGHYLAFQDGAVAPEDGDFLQPHYFAYVAAADYPMIQKLMLEGSAIRSSAVTAPTGSASPFTQL